MRGTSNTRAFTLLEMLIAIVIFTLISIYLYRSLSTLNNTNSFYGERLEAVAHDRKVLKTIYLDLSLAVIRSVVTVNQDEDIDVVLMQTKHSVHRKVMPYVAYVVTEERQLYRIESMDRLNYPFSEEDDLTVDKLGPMQHFRLYTGKKHFLLDYRIGDTDPKLVKIRGLEY